MAETLRTGPGGPNGRRHPAVPCQAPGWPHQDRPDAAPAPEPYQATELSNSEAARLIRAREQAEEAILAERGRLHSAVRAVVSAWDRAEAAIEPLRQLHARHDLAEAGQAEETVRARHADDGPEDRRVRPWYLRGHVVWPLIGITAVYDTFFLARTFQQAIDATPGTLAYIAAHIPGVAIAMAIILAGSWLAVPLFRQRSRTERRTRRPRLDWRAVLRRLFAWRPEAQERRPDDLAWPSWPLPVGFFLLVVAVLGGWAWLRSLELRVAEQRAPLVALLLLLTVTAIAFKAAAYNPYADQAAAARQRMDKARVQHMELAVHAQSAVAEHRLAWLDLRSVSAEASTRSCREFASAWADIAEARSQHGLAGPTAPPFADADTDPAACRVFADLDGPPVHAELLQQVADTLERYPPDALETELSTWRHQLNQQLTSGLGQRWSASSSS